MSPARSSRIFSGTWDSGRDRTQVVIQSADFPSAPAGAPDFCPPLRTLLLLLPPAPPVAVDPDGVACFGARASPRDWPPQLSSAGAGCRRERGAGLAGAGGSLKRFSSGSSSSSRKSASMSRKPAPPFDGRPPLGRGIVGTLGPSSKRSPRQPPEGPAASSGSSHGSRTSRISRGSRASRRSRGSRASRISRGSRMSRISRGSRMSRMSRGSRISRGSRSRGSRTSQSRGSRESRGSCGS
mmetsp:Transcript_17446/g.41410  ORF Transcript_17446/g.41410 Transcript_17446/m.41410 type:complete len:240 (+) Transcript_17446:261-980(+)